MKCYVIIKIQVLCPRSRSHRKANQNDNLCPVQDFGSLAVFKVTATDQGQYKGPPEAFVTHCNISRVFFFFFIILYCCADQVTTNFGRKKTLFTKPLETHYEIYDNRPSGI